MNSLKRRIAVSMLAAISAAHAAQAEDNVIKVVVANGPFAGTYQPPVDSTWCLRMKAPDVLAASWVDLTPKEGAIARASLHVDQPDATGAKKTGGAHLVFGVDTKPTKYDIDDVSITFKSTAKGGVITLDGATKGGVKLHVEAVCNDVGTM